MKSFGLTAWETRGVIIPLKRLFLNPLCLLSEMTVLHELLSVLCYLMKASKERHVFERSVKYTKLPVGMVLVFNECK